MAEVGDRRYGGVLARCVGMNGGSAAPGEREEVSAGEGEGKGRPIGPESTQRPLRQPVNRYRKGPAAFCRTKAEELRLSALVCTVGRRSRPQESPVLQPRPSQTADDCNYRDSGRSRQLPCPSSADARTWEAD